MLINRTALAVTAVPAVLLVCSQLRAADGFNLTNNCDGRVIVYLRESKPGARYWCWTLPKGEVLQLRLKSWAAGPFDIILRTPDDLAYHIDRVDLRKMGNGARGRGSEAIYTAELRGYWDLAKVGLFRRRFCVKYFSLPREMRESVDMLFVTEPDGTSDFGTVCEPVDHPLPYPPPSPPPKPPRKDQTIPTRARIYGNGGLKHAQPAS
jgi:hypothetical protein